MGCCSSKQEEPVEGDIEPQFNDLNTLTNDNPRAQEQGELPQRYLGAQHTNDNNINKMREEEEEDEPIPDAEAVKQQPDPEDVKQNEEAEVEPEKPVNDIMQEITVQAEISEQDSSEPPVSAYTDDENEDGVNPLAAAMSLAVKETEQARTQQ